MSSNPGASWTFQTWIWSTSTNFSKNRRISNIQANTHVALFNRSITKMIGLLQSLCYQIMFSLNKHPRKQVNADLMSESIKQENILCHFWVKTKCSCFSPSQVNENIGLVVKCLRYLKTGNTSKRVMQNVSGNHRSKLKETP